MVGRRLSATGASGVSAALLTVSFARAQPATRAETTGPDLPPNDAAAEEPPPDPSPGWMPLAPWRFDFTVGGGVAWMSSRATSQGVAQSGGAIFADVVVDIFDLASIGASLMEVLPADDASFSQVVVDPRGNQFTENSKVSIGVAALTVGSRSARQVRG